MSTPLVQEPFLVEAAGVFGPGQLEIAWQNAPRPANPALDAMIAQSWAQAVRNARRQGALLFNGPLVRYLGHRVKDGVLRIEVGPTDYADFMGTNFLNPHRAGEFGWKRYSNPIGTSAALVTSDGWLLYGRRGRRVACLPGYVHTFGGGLEPGEGGLGGTLDAFAGILRELNEELGLEPADIREILCTGLIRDLPTRQPELIFDAHISRARADIEARIHGDQPDQEHDQVVACRDEPEAIVPFIESAAPIASVAIGSLCQHGRRCFGLDWYQATMRTLGRRGG